MQDDESLRRWKEQLLGSVDLNSVGGKYNIPSINIICKYQYLTVCFLIYVSL